MTSSKNQTDTQIMIGEAAKSVRFSPDTSPVVKDNGSKKKSHDIGSCSGGSTADSGSTRNDGHESARKRVVAALELYREIIRELSHEKAAKQSMTIRRIDFHAAKEVKKIAGYVHGSTQFIGDVPGVEVGDKFRYRMELAVVRLHRPPQGGIDYMGHHSNVLATSVVASPDYADDLRNPDELLYLGQGGRPGRGKKAEDQELTRGNLALANSMTRKEPVRVIRKDWDGTFTYDGLYVVDTYRKMSRSNGKTAFEFQMKRLPSQLEICQKKKTKI